MAPGSGGGLADLRSMKHDAPASSYTAHLADPAQEDAFFVPSLHASASRSDMCGSAPTSNGWHLGRELQPQVVSVDSRTVTRGMEFGVSPFPESRVEMVLAGQLFGERTFRWLPALARSTLNTGDRKNCDTAPDCLEKPKI